MSGVTPDYAEVSIPERLLTGPPAGKSGCVRPSDLHTGLRCASSPERDGGRIAEITCLFD